MSENNMFIRDYYQYKQNNIPFRENQLLNGNNIIQNTYNNTQFHEYLQMARMKRLQKAKIMSNVNINDTDLTNYVIGPMKIEKAQPQELISDYNNLDGCYKIEIKKNKKNKKTEYDINPYLKELWNKRSNQPYKRIMHKENWEKEFNDEDDLIVHKVSKKDRNKKKLNKTYKKLLKLKKEDNKQIAEIYSADNEIQHMRDFQYSHVYKYRLKHKANNHEEMQKIYKNEQKKLNKQRNEIESALTMLLNSDILSDTDKIALQKELAKSSEKNLTNKEYKLKTKKIDSELNEMRKVLGDEEFNELINETQSIYKKNKNKEKAKAKIKAKIKAKAKAKAKAKDKEKSKAKEKIKINNDNDDDDNDDNDDNDDEQVITLTKISVNNIINTNNTNNDNDNDNDNDVDNDNDTILCRCIRYALKYYIHCP
jgi:hypothetical protein